MTDEFPMLPRDCWPPEWTAKNNYCMVCRTRCRGLFCSKTCDDRQALDDDAPHFNVADGAPMNDEARRLAAGGT